MVLTQSWWGLMARNRGGQHQRRPRLSLMGLAATTILIRSLSLKPTDWPLYLHEPSSCSTRSAHTSQHLAVWAKSYNTGDLGQSVAHAGGSCSKAGPLFTYSFQPQPHGLPLFLHYSVFFFFIFSVWINTFSVFLLLSLLFIWPSWPPTLLLIQTLLSYPGNENRVWEERGGRVAGGTGSRGGERGINFPLRHPASWPGGEREAGQQPTRPEGCCSGQSQGMNTGTSPFRNVHP